MVVFCGLNAVRFEMEVTEAVTFELLLTLRLATAFLSFSPLFSILLFLSLLPFKRTVTNAMLINWLYDCN